MELVKQYTWPGNVRRLSNALIQAAVMADGERWTDRIWWPRLGAYATIPI